MSSGSGKLDYLESAAIGLAPYRARGLAALLFGLSPPIVCALLARNSARWDLFERSGSITTAIGLFLASRRYVRYGVIELAMLHAQALHSDVAEICEDIFTAKRGLALSAFGTIIWGWGKYLRWWSFGFLLVWALFAFLDARRDLSKVGRLGLQ